MLYLAVVNRSTLASDEECQRATAAIQRQVTTQLACYWPCSVRLSFVGRGVRVPADHFSIYVQDDAPAAGTLGHHELTQGFVGVGTAQAYGVPWTAVLSHEVLETAVDPPAMLGYEERDGWYALEVCDPVSDTPATYQIDGVALENFVLPSWFQPGAKGPYDFLRLLSAPLTLTRGGFQLIHQNDQWTQKNGDGVKAFRADPHAGARRGRRMRRSH